MTVSLSSQRSHPHSAVVWVRAEGLWTPAVRVQPLVNVFLSPTLVMMTYLKKYYFKTWTAAAKHHCGLHRDSSSATMKGRLPWRLHEDPVVSIKDLYEKAPPSEKKSETIRQYSPFLA